MYRKQCLLCSEFVVPFNGRVLRVATSLFLFFVTFKVAPLAAAQRRTCHIQLVLTILYVRTNA